MKTSWNGELLTEQEIIYQQELQNKEMYEQEEAKRYKPQATGDLLDCLFDSMALALERAIENTIKEIKERQEAIERQAIIDDVKQQAEQYLAQAENIKDAQERMAKIDKVFNAIDKELHYMKTDTVQERLDINRVLSDYRQLSTACQNCTDKTQNIDLRQFSRNDRNSFNLTLEKVKEVAHEQRNSPEYYAKLRDEAWRR